MTGHDIKQLLLPSLIRLSDQLGSGSFERALSRCLFCCDVRAAGAGATWSL